MRNHRLHNGMIKGIRKMIISAVLACMCVTISFAEPVPTTQSDRIHCVTDISHEFSFYFDGRFGRNYVVPNEMNSPLCADAIDTYFQGRARNTPIWDSF